MSETHPLKRYLSRDFLSAAWLTIAFSAWFLALLGLFLYALISNRHDPTLQPFWMK